MKHEEIPHPRYRQNRLGVAIYVYVISATALFACVGLAVDGSLAYLEASKIQSVCDAACMAGSLNLTTGNSTTEAIRILVRNGVDPSEIVTVSFSPAVADDGEGIEVILTREVDTSFLRIIGFNKFTVGARAVARNSSTDDIGVCQTSGGCSTYSVFVTEQLDYSGNNAVITHDVVVHGSFSMEDGLNNEFFEDVHVGVNFLVTDNNDHVYGDLHVAGTVDTSGAQNWFLDGIQDSSPTLPAVPTVDDAQIAADAASEGQNYIYNGSSWNRPAPPDASYDGATIVWDNKDGFAMNGNVYVQGGNVTFARFDGCTGTVNILTDGVISFTKSNQHMHPDAVYNFITTNTGNDVIHWVKNQNTYNGVFFATEGGILSDFNSDIINGTIVAKRAILSGNNINIGGTCIQTALLTTETETCYHVHLYE